MAFSHQLSSQCHFDTTAWRGLACNPRLERPCERSTPCLLAQVGRARENLAEGRRGASGPLETTRSQSRSCSTRRHHFPDPSCPNRCWYPAARDDDDGSRCRLSGQRRVLPRSSTRERYPSGAPLSHLCWQSRAVWPCPLMRIRDLPSPLCVLLPLLRVETSVSGEPNHCNGSATQSVLID